MNPADTSLEQKYQDAISNPEPTVHWTQPALGASAQMPPKTSLFGYNHMALRTTLVALGVMLVIAAGAFTANLMSHHPNDDKQPQYAVSNLQLQGVKDLNLSQANELAVNGELQANQSLVLAPTAQPKAPVAGQIYFDKSSKAPFYYDGTQFVGLAPTADVASLNGATGAFTLGNGLTLVDHRISVSSSLLQQINNSKPTTVVQNSAVSGVTSLQGLTGDLTLTGGGGIGISGLTISNTGVTSLGGGTGAISLGNGLNLVSGSLVNSGVLSLAGTPNEVIIGGTGGNLNLSLPQAISTNSNPTFSGLTLGAAGNQVTLLAGATGGNLSLTLPAGDGSGGECLVTDGSGHLSFSTCLSGSGGGGSGVTSLNGQSGTVSIANATGSGGIITLHNAAADSSTKGIATFNLNDFTDNGSGVISLHTTSVTPGSYGDASHVATFTVNATGQVTAASSTPIAISGAAITSGTVGDSFLSSNVAKYNAATSNFTGALQQGGNNVCTTAGNCVGTGGSGGIGGSGTVGTVPVFTGSGFTIGNSALAQASGNLTASGQLTVQGASVTVGVAGTTAGTLVLSSPSAGGSVVLKTATSGQTASGTALFPAFSGNDTVCLQTVGNCSGVNAGGGDTSYIFNQTAQQTSANINIQARSASVAATIQGAVGQNIINLISSGGQTAASVDANGQLTLGNASAGSLAGKINFADGTNDGFTSTLQSATLSHSINISLPYSTGNAGNFQDVICLQFASNCTGGITGSGANGQVAYFTGAGTIASSSLLSFNSVNGNLTFGASSVLGAATNTANNTTGYTLALQGGNETGNTSIGGGVNIDAGTGTSTNGSINIGTGNAASLGLGNASKTTNITLKTNGTSATAFTVQNASGINVLTADTLNKRVAVGGSEVSYLNPNWGTGVFSVGANTNYATALQINYDITTGDLNNDGYPDIIDSGYYGTAASGQGDYNINNGNGTFNGGNHPGFGSAPVTAKGIVAVDINSDNIPELIYDVPYPTSETIQIYSGLSLTPSTPMTLPNNSNPWGMVAADVNNDGRKDVLVAENGAASVAVLGNNGNGTLANPVTYTVGNGPEWLAAGDLNHDGYADIVTANNTDGTISVLLNNGNGTFATQSTYAVGTAPTSVAIGDINGDGSPDLVVAYNTNQVKVFLNNGSGTSFSAGASSTVGNGVQEIAGADMDGDGLTDFVVANNTSNSVSFLKNNGNGTLAAAQNFGVCTSPVGLTLADVSNDGRKDILTACSTSSNVSVLLNTTGGQAVYKPTLSVTATAPGEGGLYIQGATSQTANLFVIQDASGNPLLNVDASGNLSASGKTMLTTAGASNVGLTIKAALAQTADLMDLQNSSGQQLASFNNNGQLILGNASTGSAAGKISLADGTNDGFLVSLSTAVQGNNVSLTVPTDTNTTDTLCLQSAGNCNQVNNGTVGQVAYFSSTNKVSSSSLISMDLSNSRVSVGTHVTTGGTLNLADKTDYTTGSNPRGVATSDVNGDGYPDIVTTNSGANTVSVLINNGNGTYAAQATYSTGSNPVAIATSDVNGDGHPDIVTASANTRFVSVLINNGNGTFAGPVSYDDGGFFQSGVTTSDVNGDGRPDIIASGSTFAAVLINNGNGTFGFQALYNYSGAGGVATADFNGDGHPDIVLPGVSVLMNAGSGIFAGQVTYSVSGSVDVATADFNGDGHPDIVSSNKNLHNVSVLINNGNGTFGTPVTYSTGSSPVGVTTGDFNGDGHPDIVAADSGAGAVSVLINNGNGTFAAKQDFVVGSGPDDVATSDVNGDGYQDIVSSNISGQSDSVLLNITGGLPPIASTLSVVATSATEGGLIVQGASGQTANMLVLQNASGKQLLTVNAFGNLTLGNASTGSLAGKLSLADGTNDGFLVSIATAVQGNNVSLTIPTDTNSTDTICLQTKANCGGGGLGGSGTLNQVAYFTGASTVGSSSLMTLDTTNGILTVSSASATALKVMNGGTVEFVVDAANGRVGINTGATAPGANLTVNGSNNINPSWPDGLVGTPTAQTVTDTTTYTVPAGKTLYITSMADNGSVGTQLLDTSGAIYYIIPNNQLILTSPIPVAAGTTLKASSSLDSISFSGMLINSTVTPVFQKVTDTTTYTVPAGKTLYITGSMSSMYVAHINLIDSSGNIYMIMWLSNPASISLGAPIPIAAGTVLKASQSTGLWFTGYLTNSNGYGGP
ncbi:MAG TPA: VCBS repeat-containing protein [Candidatus Saccharimonadales bacterium]|nr:VCBS repeat-containing protein [Candidatus Saccharimonadales bacterium]